MLSLTSYEKKVLVFVGGVLLLGAFLRVTGIPAGKDGDEEHATLVPVNQPKKFNINEASLQELVVIPSIGEKTARSIIEYRTRYGNFSSTEDIIKVKGIGSKKVEIIKRYITFE